MRRVCALPAAVVTGSKFLRHRKKIGVARATPIFGLTLAVAIPLECEVQRHLQEARTADGVLDHSELSARRTDVSALYADSGRSSSAWSKTSSCVLGWIGEERIELDVVVWRIETGVVKDVKGLNVKA